MSALVEMETGMQYQQNFPQQQTQDISLPIEGASTAAAATESSSSYLAAVSGNNYAKQTRKKKRPLHVNRRNMQSYRQTLGAATNNYDTYASTAPAQTGPYAGYSSSSTGGEYHDYTPNSHVTTGAVSSYQPNSGSGYVAAPAHPPYPPINDVHPHPYVSPQPSPVYHAPPTYSFSKPSKIKVKSKSKKKQGDSTISALTLLSFFFFVNLLQNCLKEHMNTMNPTVMVMTVNGVRNRFNKLAEMNSREQNAAAVPSDSSTSYSNMAEPEVLSGQSPYSSDLISAHKDENTNNNNKKDINNMHYTESNTQNIEMANTNKQQHNNDYKMADEKQSSIHTHANSFSNQSMRPEFYDSIHSYRRRNYSTPKVFNAYFRSTSTGSDKSHNYSYQNNMDITREHNATTYSFDKSYDSSLGVTPAPTSYWSLAAVTSSASDFFQHHPYYDDDDDIERRYYAQHN